MTVDTARRRQLMARWHRRVAVIVAAWLIALACTGVLINHAHGWRLDSTPAPHFIQAWFYGIDSYPTGLCGARETVGVDCDHVFARMELDQGTLLFSKDSLFLLDNNGQLVEKLLAGMFGLEELKAVFQEDARIYLRDGDITVITNGELLGFEVLDPVAAGVLNDRPWIQRPDKVQNISWERLFLDLHAARFLGPFATWFNDLMAILILVLAVSGLWLYSLKLKPNGKDGGGP